jgi:hypothetical protein
MLVCLLIELNIQLTGGPANSGAVQVRPIKGVAVIAEVGGYLAIKVSLVFGSSSTSALGRTNRHRRLAAQ